MLAFVVHFSLLLLPTVLSMPPTMLRDQGVEQQQQQQQNEEDFKSYIDKINHMEYNDLLANLNLLLSGQTGLDLLDREVKLLNRVKQYEELKETVREFGPYLQIGSGGAMHYDDDELEQMDKRTVERVDKEDDWLGDYDLYLKQSEDGSPLLSSRRRLYPTEEEEDSSEEEKEMRHLAKKDLESLMYQANPALTVHHLSPEPLISFRKFHQEEETTTTTVSPAPPAATTERPHQQRLGMKPRPGISTRSPAEQLKEEKELEDLIA